MSDEELKELDGYYEKIRGECERRGHHKPQNEVARTLENGRNGKTTVQKKPAA